MSWVYNIIISFHVAFSEIIWYEKGGKKLWKKKKGSSNGNGREEGKKREKQPHIIYFQNCQVLRLASLSVVDDVVDFAYEE